MSEPLEPTIRQWMEWYKEDCVQAYTQDGTPIWIKLQEFIDKYDSLNRQVTQVKRAVNG